MMTPETIAKIKALMAEAFVYEEDLEELTKAKAVLEEIAVRSRQ